MVLFGFKMQNSKLTVAKVCHEIAGHLSIICFMKDDISDEVSVTQQNISEGVSSLFTELELLMKLVEFFRSIYSVSENSNNIIDHTLEILKHKHISVENQSNLMTLGGGYEECIVCGILYMISKVCKKHTNIKIRKDEYGSIYIGISQSLRSPSILDSLCDNETECNLFNVFAKYIQSLITQRSYKFALDTLSDNESVIKLYKSQS